MSTELAKTGIDVIGAVPWGTHFCQFYQTKQDLLDTLVPYFKTGLENNEFCMWITAEPLSAQEARKAMRRAMPDFADRLSRGQIEILPHTEWYLKDGSFDQQRVLNGWVDKLNTALAAGYAGLRLTGNTFWLEKRDWKSFTDYEAAVNDVIGKYHMLALCTYSLDKCGATEVMDVIRNHEFALIRKEGKWELIENAVYKQAKQALLESEKKYRQLMENLHEGVGVVDKDLHLTFVNPHMAKVLGYTTDEILGEPVFKFIDESKWSATKQLMEQRLQGISENVEIELRRKDGSLLPVLISATPLTDDHGDFSGFVAGFADITERKQTEESMRRAKEEWERTFDSVPDLIAILDDQHRIVRVNKAMAARLACAPEQCVGLHCYKAVHGTDAPPAFCPHTKTITDQREHIEEVREDRLGGDFLVSTNPILDSQGRLIGSVHVARDITERKRREEKILKLTRLYAVLSRASEAIVRIGDANSLCSEICRIVAEEGGFPLVWIGQVEEQHVVPSAWSGPAVGYLKELKVEVQGELGRGPTGTCIRENRAVVNNDFATNTTVSPWREVALSYSFRASAAFPLRREGKAIGALSLYSFEANAFDADQIRLLESLGSDVSYALDSIGQEKRRIQAEETLRESEERLNRAQDIAHIGSWELDLLNNRLTWSDEVYRIFGLQPQEFGATYEAFLEAVHPDDRAAVNAAYSGSIREGRDTYEIEHRIVRRSNGQVRIVHERCEHMRDPSGRIIRSVGMVHDITERKQAEESLRETHDYLDSLLNYANAPIIVWDRDFRITRFNRAFQRLTGYRENEVLGKELHILFPEQTREESLAHIDRAVAGERWEVIEIPIQRADGVVRTILWNSANILASDGETTVATIAQGQDITERKQAEDDLRETRDYLDNLLNYANAPIIVWDPELRITKFNRAFQKLTGYAEAEVVGKRLDMLFPEQSREESLVHINRAAAGERWEVIEIPIRRVDGTVRTVLWNSANIRASDGETTVATIAQGQDITERKQAEESLRDAMLRFRTVADNTYDFEFWINPEGQFLYASPSSQRVYDRTPAEFLADPGLRRRVVHPDDLATFDRHIAEETRQIQGEIVFRIVRPDGTFRWIAHVCQLVFDEHGQYLGVRGSNRDVTEQKQAQDALRETRDYLDNLLNYANAPIIVWDPELRITKFNRAFQRLTGYAEAEVVGKRLDILFPEQSREESLVHISRAAAGERWEVIEIPIRRVDGTVRTVLWNSANILASDGQATVATIAQGQDITERKQAEEAVLALNETLRQRALQLEATNKELEAFAYSVSHDLRAPLRSIDGFSLALLEDYANKLDDQGKDCLHRVRAASQLMGELIDDMLKLSRVSRAEIHWRRVDLSGLAQKIAQELQDSEPKRRVKFNIAPDLLVYGDGPLLRVALENLLSNAWKFTGKRDRPKIEFGARKEDGLQVYFVKDNGVGFDMSYVSKIFEPFQRLHSKNEFPGTGIGLATVRRIIDRHGGRVWAEGKVGDGATFYFTLSDHSERERR